MGGGSAQLNPHYRVSPWDGLVAALGDERLSYADGLHQPPLRAAADRRLHASSSSTRPTSPARSSTPRRMAEAQAFWIGAVGGGKVDPARFSARLTGRFVARGHRRRTASAPSPPAWSGCSVDGALVADAWTGWTPGATFFEEGCDEVVGTVELDRRPARTRSSSSSPPGRRAPSASPPSASASASRSATPRSPRRSTRPRAADTALVFVGRNGEWDTEGSDLPDIALPGRQDELVAAVAAANPRTVVVLQTGGPVEMPWLDAVPAVLEAWYPGQEAGNAIADVLLGAAEPGGRLPQTFPRAWADNPTASRDPEVYPGRDGRVRYAEGVFIGYRHYDRAGIAPLFPFGHGLGYTTFELAHFAAEATEDGVAIRAILTNTGDRPGAAVLQVYVAPHRPPVPRPAKELKAFAKVRCAPGESRPVTLLLTLRDLAWWDADARAWQVTAGRFDILAGFSATDIRGSSTISIGRARTLPP